MVMVENEPLESWELESTEAVSDAKVKLAIAKEALPVLEGHLSADRSVARIAIEVRDRLKDELDTTSAKPPGFERCSYGSV